MTSSYKPGGSVEMLLNNRMRILIPVLVVLVVVSAVIWRARDHTDTYTPPEPIAEESSVPQSVDDLLREILTPSLRGSPTISAKVVAALLEADDSLVVPDQDKLKAEIQNFVDNPVPLKAEYVVTQGYGSDGDSAYVQPLKSWQVTESADDIEWFEWLDERTLVYSTAHGLFRKRLHEPEVSLARAPMAQMSVPSLSPDKRRIAAISSGAMLVASTDSGSQVFHPFETPMFSITWSPDSRQIAFTTRMSLHVLDPETGETRCLYSVSHLPHPEAFNPENPVAVLRTEDVQWSPNGKQIYVRQPLEEGYVSLTILRASDGRIVERLDGWNDPYLSWSPDGSGYCYADSCGDADTSVFAGGKHLICMGPGHSWGQSKWSADGRCIAIECTGTVYGLGSLISFIDGPSTFGVYSKPLTRRPSSSRPLSFDWHPRDLVLAEVNTMSPGLRYELPVSEQLPGFGWRLRIASFELEDSVNDSYHGHPVRILSATAMPPHAGRKKTPRWSPDGRRLAVLCDVSGSWQVHISHPTIETRSAASAERWSAQGMRHLRAGDIPRAITCFQNVMRLGASEEIRLRLISCYLDLAESERNPFWRSQLYFGAAYEASNVPFGSLNPETKKRLMQAIVNYDALRSVSFQISDEYRAERQRRLHGRQ